MLFDVSLKSLGKRGVVGVLSAGLLALATIFACPLTAGAATGAITTNHWANGAVEGYELIFRVSDSNLGTVTVVSGPGITDPVDLSNDINDVASYTLPVSARPSATDTYVLTVTDNGGVAQPGLTLQPTGVNDVFAGIAERSKGYALSATPTFAWTAPAVPPTGFSGYLISVAGADLQWQPAKLGTAVTSAQFNYDATASKAIPTPSVPYNWSVAVVDGNGNLAETRGAVFMMGPNFTGKVTDMSLAGLPGVRVQALDATGASQGAAATTQADGTYLYGGLQAGSYTIRFMKTLDPNAVYYNNQLFVQKADPLTVTSGVITPGINAVMGAWGEITGKVVNAAKAGISGVVVNLCDATGQALSTIAAVTTNSNGIYRIPLVPAGGYKIRFNGNSQYAGKLFPEGASTFDVLASLTTTVDAELLAANIAGKVSDASGAGIPNVQVYLYDSASNPLSFTVSQSDGTYAMSGIVPGSYKVGFLPVLPSPYIRQYYNQKTTRQLADLVTVSAAAPLVINATLGTGVPTVTSFSVPASADGLTVSGIVITAVEPNGVAGYLLTESPATPSSTVSGWTTAAPTSYTFAGAGNKTLYAWAKGSTGLVSASLSGTVDVGRSFPTLRLSMLGDLAVTANPTLNVAGTVGVPAGSVSSLTVNGAAVAVDPADDSFSFPVRLVEGANTVTVVATGSTGLNTSVTRSITLDRTAPLLLISAPADNIATTAANIDITGSIPLNSTVELLVNGGTSQQAGVNGTDFSANVNLVPGLNTIEIVATDSANRKSHAKRTVTLVAGAPDLAVTGPAQDATTSQTTLTITGTVSASSAVSVAITANGQVYTPQVVSGAFSQAVTLGAGNTYAVVVTATDASDIKTTVRRNIMVGKAGDVNGDGIVSISEVRSAIGMFLGAEVSIATVDLNADNVVSLSELQDVINACIGL